MKKILAYMLGICLSLTMVSVYAFEGITFYSTTITPHERYNSSGMRLTTVASILHQDRANKYNYGYSNPTNQNDSFFSNAANRNIFESVPIVVNPGLAKVIINGGPVEITVFVFQDHIEVK
jgi:hypothetical protein